MATTLLIIDDDVALCEVFQLMLTKKGYQVEVAYDAISGLQKGYALKPDVVILDIMLPDMDGWQVCRRFREMSDVPIIMLTALGTEKSAVKGLNLGADDYIIKPVTAEELAARVRAVLRRAYGSDQSGIGQESILSSGNLAIDLGQHLVTVDGKRVKLSPTEFRLLWVLAQHRGKVLSHKFLLTEVWGLEYIDQVDLLRLYIGYLRRKLEKDPSKPTLIHNVWGTGYQFK